MGKRWIRLLLCLVVLLPMAACTTDPDVQVGYSPPLVPVKLSLSEAGISVSGDQSLVTPLGTFSIGAKYSLDPVSTDAIRVVVQDKSEGPMGFQHVYDVTTGAGEFTAVVNGKTTIQVSERQVLIDVTEGTIESIQLKGIEPVAKTDSDSGNAVTAAGDRWTRYWDTAFYSPFALSRWAYDDSTMGDWFGLGFLWFLVRLIAAFVLAIVDVILCLACLFAAIGALLFGDVGRNIVYGVEALFALLVVMVGVAAVADDW